MDSTLTPKEQKILRDKIESQGWESIEAFLMEVEQPPVFSVNIDKDIRSVRVRSEVMFTMLGGAIRCNFLVS